MEEGNKETTTISTTINAMEVIVGWRRNQRTKLSKMKRKYFQKLRGNYFVWVDPLSRISDLFCHSSSRSVALD